MSRATILQAGAAAAVLALGVTGALSGYFLFQGREALTGLLTGLIVAGCGLVAWRRASVSRLGPLLVLAALAWFPSDWRLPAEPIGSASHWLALGYASLMTHALLTYPSGRAERPIRRGLIGLAYVSALLPPVAGSAILASLLALYLGWVIRSRGPADPDERLPAAIQGATFGVVLLATTAIRFVVVGGRTIDLRLVLELGFVITAAVVAGLLLRTRDRSSAADLVLDLGDERGGSLAFQLRLVLGDPTLQVGFRLAGGETFVDADGRPLRPPGAGDDRAATFIERDGSRVAVLVHRPQLATDPILTDALAKVAGLAATNARLQAQLRAQMAEVRASRRRLVAAGDEERAVLERRLRQGPERRLSTLTDSLAESDGSAAVMVPVGRAIAQMSGARLELAELGDGLRPTILDRLGLAGSVADLAQRCPTPVEARIALDVARPSPAAAATLYFVTSEGLANITKHAEASHAWLSIDTRADGYRLEIRDDGVGGADLAHGTGLRGLRDRVEAIGGTLELRSAPGDGTHLAVTIPSDGEVPWSMEREDLLDALPGPIEPRGVVRVQP